MYYEPKEISTVKKNQINYMKQLRMKGGEEYKAMGYMSVLSSEREGGKRVPFSCWLLHSLESVARAEELALHACVM